MQGTMGGEMVEAGGDLASRERKEESIGVISRSYLMFSRVERILFPIELGWRCIFYLYIFLA